MANCDNQANDAGSILEGYHYAYDAAGNRLWKQNAGPGATGLDGPGKRDITDIGEVGNENE